MKTEAIPIEQTPRLQREAQAWVRHGMRPDDIQVPGIGQESVWDYPRPPSVQRVLERVTVELAGELLADTQRALRVCETASPPTYYIPPGDVIVDRLERVGGSSQCEWKGRASYYSVRGGPARAVWAYTNPTDEYAVLRDHLAFYPAHFVCTVAGMPVTPQPGTFYGGWVTPDLVGPFKGEPGSSGW